MSCAYCAPLIALVEHVGQNAQIAQNGPALWIDRNIVGGDEWVAELEARIQQCSALIAFITPQFMESRYCRREVQFADALGKAIIPVVLQAAALGGGLQFILQGIQLVDLTGPNMSPAQLSHAIQKLTNMQRSFVAPP